jgi:hypothetical protein
MMACRACGCTDGDCAPCIVRTGEPCTWVDAELCSACVPGAPTISSDRPLAVLTVDDGFDGFGWYWIDAENPELGAVGVFDKRITAAAHAILEGYRVQ